MRIQNEINPINAEYENRKAYDEKLKWTLREKHQQINQLRQQICGKKF